MTDDSGTSGFDADDFDADDFYDGADETAPARAQQAPEVREPGDDAVAAYLANTDLEWETGARPGEYVITLPGEKKLKTVVSVIVRPRTTSLSAFVIRHPDENEARFYRTLLRRNLRMPSLAYAVDDDGDVYVRGDVPTGALDDRLIDALLGVVLEAADVPFNDLLAIGFLTSMRKEWAWRVKNGESTRNLEAFRHLLDGSAP